MRALEDARLVEQGRALDQAGDDVAVETGHRPPRPSPLFERDVRVSPRERGEEALVDELLHPGISLLADLGDLRTLDLAVRREGHGDAHRAVDGVLGQEGDRPEVALL